MRVVAGGHIIDLVSGFLQDLAGDLGRDLRSRPFEHGQPDRLVHSPHLGGGCGDGTKRKHAGQGGGQESNHVRSFFSSPAEAGPATIAGSPHHNAPPVIWMFSMVMPRAPSVHRKAASDAISSGWTIRCCGFSAATSSSAL